MQIETLNFNKPFHIKCLGIYPRFSIKINIQRWLLPSKIIGSSTSVLASRREKPFPVPDHETQNKLDKDHRL